MALSNREGYWKETNERQNKKLSDYIKSGGKDKIRIKNMKSDIKYSSSYDLGKTKYLVPGGTGRVHPLQKQLMASKMPKKEKLSKKVISVGKPVKRKKGESAWSHLNRWDNKANNK